MRPRSWLVLAAMVSAAFTVLVSVPSPLRYAYRDPAAHVAVETAAAIVSLLAGQLMYGRFRRSLERRDLALTAALGVFGTANLSFSLIPAVAEADGGAFTTWARIGGSLLAAGLLVAGTFLAPCTLHHPARAARQWLLGCVAGLLAIAVAVALSADWLPRGVDMGLSPEASTGPRIIGDPAVVVAQLVIMLFFAAAAVGLGRRAERTRDPLTLWFAIGATLAAFARINYFLFPSLYSEYFYAGDVLRLGFFIALLVGGLQEIRVTQRILEATAVADERRRIARELHDGMAQDLAFIVQQGRRLADRNGAGDIVVAAQRALDDSRDAIAALVRPTDETLTAALERTADQVARREGVAVEVEAAPDLAVAAQAREALLRIAGEALTNAARHGRAERVRLELSEGPGVRLRIVDDGAGFVPESAMADDTRHGLVGMRERAERLGGTLEIRSSPGAGAEVLVQLP